MTAKLNRAVRCTAAMLAVIAVGAGATACNASSDTSSKAGSSAAKNSLSDSQESVGKGVKKTAAKDSRTDAVNTASASTSGKQSKRCHTGDLRFTWGGPNGGRPDMETTYQQNASIKLKNTSGRTCTLRGFPGVRLISKDGDAWDLRRSSVKPSTFTLRPGDDTAAVSINLLPVSKDDPDAKPFVPSKVLITPPDETTHVTLKWPYGGAILDQSGATRPGTFVDPIVIG